MNEFDAMNLALKLAKAEQGFTSPNPPVGAVIFKNNAILGAGATQPYGGPHAEIMALREAGSSATGAAMAVTLEPHSFFGHTPPCTNAIIAAGITKVIIATTDPNPLVSGNGVRQLQNAGITTEVLQQNNSQSAEAQELIAPFRHWLNHKEPMGIAKIAMSMDGKIATSRRESQWITGPESRRAGHLLRQRCDVILIGAQTLLQDDPLLTTRLPDEKELRVRHPVRVVLDSQGRTPATAKMLRPDTPGKTIIAATPATPEIWRETMRNAGAELLILPATVAGRVDISALWQELGKRGCITALIEGGATVLGACFAANLVYRAHIFLAPIVIGGVSALSPVGDPGFAALADAPRFQWSSAEHCGEDIYIFGKKIENYP